MSVFKSLFVKQDNNIGYLQMVFPNWLASLLPPASPMLLEIKSFAPFANASPSFNKGMHASAVWTCGDVCWVNNSE
jgi:hypothetical protein